MQHGSLQVRQVPRERLSEWCAGLFDQRFSWESVGQVTLCCRCHVACLRQQQQTDVVTAVRCKAVSALLETLQQGECAGVQVVVEVSAS